MPSLLVFESGRRHAIEISAARDGRRHREWIAHLRAFRLRLGRHREKADRAAKGSGWIWWQRFHFQHRRLALQLDLARSAWRERAIVEKVIEKRIVHVEEVARDSGISRSARNPHDRIDLCRADLNFAAARGRDCRLEREGLKRLSVDRLDILPRLAHLLGGEALAGNLNAVAERFDGSPHIEAEPHDGGNHFADVAARFAQRHLDERDLARVHGLGSLTRLGRWRGGIRRQAARPGLLPHQPHHPPRR